MTYVAFGYNEVDPDLALGPLAYRTQDPEACKRFRSSAGNPLVDVIIDAEAYRKKSLEKTSFLRATENRWVLVSAGSAFIMLYGGQYDITAAMELLNYD